MLDPSGLEEDVLPADGNSVSRCQLGPCRCTCLRPSLPMSKKGLARLARLQFGEWESEAEKSWKRDTAREVSMAVALGAGSMSHAGWQLGAGRTPPLKVFLYNPCSLNSVGRLEDVAATLRANLCWHRNPCGISASILTCTLDGVNGSVSLVRGRLLFSHWVGSGRCPEWYEPRLCRDRLLGILLCQMFRLLRSR